MQMSNIIGANATFDALFANGLRGTRLNSKFSLTVWIFVSSLLNFGNVISRNANGELNCTLEWIA